jgi:3-phosphoshikimate 1-carboxyvinyltransferase
MTLRVLADHGLEIEVNSERSRFRVDGGQSAHSHDHNVEGDYSAAAFILAAGAITNSEIGVSGLRTSDSLQGDSKILQFLTEMGAHLDIGNETVWVRSSKLRGVQVEAGDYPDLVPPITATACYAQGTTRIVNAERLRIKESDRLAALTCELRKMGATIQETSDGLEINGPAQLHGTNIDSHGDHRIAMACATAALAAKGEVAIDGAHCVAKSYPSFFDDLRHLGGDIVGWQ